MPPEFLEVLAAFLLSMAAMAGGLAMFNVRGPWAAFVLAARGAGMAALIAYLSLAVVVQGEWSPFDRQLLALTLVLTMLAIQMALTWCLRIGTAGPTVDLVAVILIVVATAGIPSGVSLPSCIQLAAPTQVQWALLLVGCGGVLVAGNAGLMLALRKGLYGHGWDLVLPNRADLHSLLTQATFLALALLSSGLTISVWWAHQSAGRLSGGDLQEGWIAATWLVTAMSLLAWQLGSQRGRWAAGLAVVAEAMLLVGLLV